MKINSRLNSALYQIKPYLKPFLILFAIYALALFTIIRANYSYMDDIGRSIHGYAWNADFNRYSSSILSYIINLNTRLSDISPLPQLLAAAIMSITSLVIARALSAKSKLPNYSVLLSATLMGLCPFMLGCWVFKFDAPCMTLSILVSVIPALFYLHNDNRRSHIISFALTTLLTLIMWSSYQASSGVMPITVLMMMFFDIVFNNARLKSIVLRATPLAFGYIVGSLLFYLTLGHANAVSYRQANMYPLSQLLSGIAHNITDMLLAVANSMTTLWTGLIVLMILSFVVAIASLGKSVRQRVGFGLLAVILIVVAAPLSYGSYLVLQNAPSYYGRSFVGLSVLLGLVAAMTAAAISRNDVKAKLWNLLLAPTAIAGFAFIVYSLALGNALFDQRQFANTRLNQLSNDLSQIYKSDDISGLRMRIIGDIGMSPVMSHLQELYPITKSVSIDLQTGLNGLSVWGYRQLEEYYGWNMTEDTNNQLRCDRAVLNDHYFNIKQDSKRNVCIEIK